MKVKELIEVLQKFDSELEVCLQVREDTSTINQIRIETKDNHSYDQGDHVLEYCDFNKCVMLSDDDYYSLNEDLTLNEEE